jgi:hypothetical protein
MLAHLVHKDVGNAYKRISGHVLVASFRWCRRSVAVFEAEEAITI